MPEVKAKTRRRLAFAPRNKGGRTIPGALDGQLMARGLNSDDLCRLTGLDGHTIRRARRGDLRITQRTLLKIADALIKVPVLPMAAYLVGVQAPTNRRLT